MCCGQGHAPFGGGLSLPAPKAHQGSRCRRDRTALPAAQVAGGWRRGLGEEGHRQWLAEWAGQRSLWHEQGRRLRTCITSGGVVSSSIVTEYAVHASQSSAARVQPSGRDTAAALAAPTNRVATTNQARSERGRAMACAVGRRRVETCDGVLATQPARDTRYRS